MRCDEPEASATVVLRRRHHQNPPSSNNASGSILPPPPPPEAAGGVTGVGVGVGAGVLPPMAIASGQALPETLARADVLTAEGPMFTSARSVAPEESVTVSRSCRVPLEGATTVAAALLAPDTSDPPVPLLITLQA